MGLNKELVLNGKKLLLYEGESPRILDKIIRAENLSENLDLTLIFMI